MSDVYDHSNEFDKRLDQISRFHPDKPSGEVDRAVNAYERLVTARAICRSVVGEEFPHELLQSVFAELCRDRNADT